MSNFSKENIDMVNRHIKRYLTSPITREIQVSCSEVSPHPHQNGHHQKVYK